MLFRPSDSASWQMAAAIRLCGASEPGSAISQHFVARKRPLLTAGGNIIRWPWRNAALGGWDCGQATSFRLALDLDLS